MDILINCFACLLATAFFGNLLRQPKGTLIYTSLIAINGYVLFLLLGQDLRAYFLSGLLVGFLCELTARIRKMTTTLFLISGIIPLVPGLGLYRSVLFIAERNYQMALITGIDTLGGIGAIAMAITITSMLFSNIPFLRYPSKGAKDAPTHHQR